MFTLVCGDVGSGKTLLSVLECIRDDGDYVVTNQPIDERKVNALYGLTGTQLDDPISHGGKRIVEYGGLEERAVTDACCGALLIDEAHMFMDAREWEKLPKSAKRKVQEHRKDDLSGFVTTLDWTQIDKVYRNMVNEVWIVSMLRLPLLGWIWKKCRRPTMYCAKCGRRARDGAGDDSSAFLRWLGFGTYFKVERYHRRIIGAGEAIQVDDDSMDRYLKGVRFRLFNVRVADCYATKCKLSEKADAYMKGISNSLKQRKWRPRLGSSSCPA